MSAPRAALAGIRVVDFGHHVPGPLVGMLLGDAGADVVHVSAPDARPSHSDAVLNRSKRSLTLDLHTGAGLGDARALVADADVVIENVRPGVMESLGLGFDRCSQCRYCRCIQL